MENEIRRAKLASCGGCGAKVGAGTLAKLLKGLPSVYDERLLVGYDTSDDACVYKISDDLVLVETLDFFPPIVDDPFMFGQIAAANAISDIYAMGAQPKLALNIMAVSPQVPDEAVREVLRGGYTVERVMHSPCGGVFHALREIGDTVEAGETVATVGGEPLYAKITGTLRGILPEGFEVPREHFKSADVDPRCRLFHCFTVSDKALSVGGGVLEAVLMLTSAVGTARKPERRGEDYGK